MEIFELEVGSRVCNRHEICQNISEERIGIRTEIAIAILMNLIPLPKNGKRNYSVWAEMMNHDVGTKLSSLSLYDLLAKLKKEDHVSCQVLPSSFSRNVSKVQSLNKGGSQNFSKT